MVKQSIFPYKMILGSKRRLESINIILRVGVAFHKFNRGSGMPSLLLLAPTGTLASNPVLRVHLSILWVHVSNNGIGKCEYMGYSTSAEKDDILAM
jgi:hypothetical protein